MLIRSTVAVMVAALAAGCASGNDSAPDGGAPAASGSGVAARALPCDVSRVLAARCQSCHQRPPIYGAPMPLVTWADAQARSSGGSEVWQAMKAKLMAGLMPPAGAPGGALSAPEKSTLMGWLDAGAPAGDGAACDTPMP